MTLPLDFDELLKRAKSGDADAIAELVRQYEPEVRMVARVRLGPALRPHLDSIDLVQSVHKSLMIGLSKDQYDVASPQKLIALAVTIVQRKVAKQWRKLRRQQRLECHESGGNLPDLLASLTAADADPATLAERRNEMEHLLAGLDERERRLLELRIAGFSTAEAARELNVDADVLRVRLSRLRKRLRQSQTLADFV